MFTLALLFCNLYVLKIIHYYFIILATIVLFSLSYYGLVCLLVLDTGLFFKVRTQSGITIGLANAGMVIALGMEFV